MTLFGDVTPDYNGYCPDTMPAAEYLRRSTRGPIEHVRIALEDWFSFYPTADRPRLRSEFHSSSDTQHKSAFFELFLHEFLRRNGWTIQVHPPVRGTTRVPDFLCTRGEISLYVEAKIATGRSAQEEAAVKRLEVALDTINRRLRSRRYYLSVSTRGLPITPIRGRDLAERLERWLNGIDYETYLQRVSTGQTESFAFEEAECQINFDALARPEAEEDHERIIGVLTYGHEGGWITPYLTIRQAVEEKANAYGNLNAPYVIAINTHDIFANTPEDALEALYGREQTAVQVLADGRTERRDERMRDGTFGYPGSPYRQHVSGVLIFNNVGPAALGGERRGVYVPHVFTNRPIPLPFPTASTINHENNSFRFNQAQALTETMGLPDGWPLHEDNAGS